MKNLLLALAALASCNALADIRAVTPTPWNGKPDCWQMKRHAEKMNVVTNGGSKVVFIGDSITHFWETKGGKAQWDKYFAGKPHKALNLGTSADRTEHVLWRITKGKELDGYEAKFVNLMIGTNNTGHFPFEKEPPADTILGVRKIIRTIQKKQTNAVIVLNAIFARGTNATDSCRLRNDIVNAEIRKFADGKRVFWCDFTDRFLDADGNLPKALFPDALHPSAAGYEIWYEELKPYLDYALSDRKGPAPAHRFAKNEKAKGNEPPAVCPATRIMERRRNRADDWWTDRLLQKRNQIADSKGKIDLVFFGDSITRNWEKAGKESLARLRKTYSVLDIGYGGDRTEHLIWRGENGELDGYEAKCVMLMVGTNNTWHRKDKPEDIAAGIRKVLDVIARKQPKAQVLLLPIFPFGDSPAHKNRVNNEAVNAIIKNYADGKRVVWVDFNAKFLDEKGDNKKWMPDHCHPNAEGYEQIWLPAVLPYFKAACGK